MRGGLLNLNNYLECEVRRSNNMAFLPAPAAAIRPCRTSEKEVLLSLVMLHHEWLGCLRSTELAVTTWTWILVPSVSYLI